MFCQKCGAQIPDDSVFCRSCGAPVPGAQGGQKTRTSSQPAPLFANLLNQLKGFFSGKPESGLKLAGESNTHEWSILIGANILVFAFAYAVNLIEMSKGLLGGLISIKFGFGLLFGFLISLVANVILFGGYLLLEKVIHRGEQPIVGALNTVAYSTIPVTIICLFNMLFGLIWFYLIIPFFITAIFAQLFLLLIALKDNAKDHKVSFLLVIAIFFAIFTLTLLFGYLFTKAGMSASVKSSYSSFSGYDYGGYGW